MIRHATRADFVAFFGAAPPMTVRALAFERDGEVKGLGGYFLADGVAVAFSNVRGMTKREIVKGARALLLMLRECGVPVVATSGPEGEVALKHYGFVPFGMFWRLT